MSHDTYQQTLTLQFLHLQVPSSDFLPSLTLKKIDQINHAKRNWGTC